MEEVNSHTLTLQGSQEWFNRAGLGAVGREWEGSPNRVLLKVHVCWVVAAVAKGL